MGVFGRLAGGVVTAVVVLAGPPALAALSGQQWDLCTGPSTDAGLTACTAVIQSPGLTPSDRAAAYRARGITYSDLGQDDHAISDYDAAIRLKPDFADAFVTRGNAYNRGRQYDRAIADFDVAIRLNPGDASAFYSRATAYTSKGLLARAITDYDASIRLKPNDANAFMGRGSAYDDLGQYDRAISDYDIAIRLKPDFANALVNRGVTYKNQGLFDRAIADYDAAIRLQPELSAAFNNRGIAYKDKRQYDRAISDYDTAIRLKPNYATAFYNRAITYNNKGQPDKAIADYSAAIRLDPNEAKAFMGRGSVYDDLGQYDRAIADYDTAIRLKPDFADALVNRGVSYKNKGLYDQAVVDYDAALRLQPVDAIAVANRAIAVAKLGNDEEAVAELRRALVMNPKLGYAKSALDELVSLQKAAEAQRTRSAIPGRRIALVIGNTEYAHLPKVPNASGDATAVAKALSSLGFAVTPVVPNLNDRALKAAVKGFYDAAFSADVAVVWYIGHGQTLESGDRKAGTESLQTDNFILPTDFAPGDDVYEKAMTVGALMAAVAPAKGLRLVVIDACRTLNLTSRRTGFVEPKAPPAAAGKASVQDFPRLVVYSTDSNAAAQDGPTNGHSPFTQAFLEVLSSPSVRGADIRNVFSGVRGRTIQIAQNMGKTQRPLVYDQLNTIENLPLVAAK